MIISLQPSYLQAILCSRGKMFTAIACMPTTIYSGLPIKSRRVCPFCAVGSCGRHTSSCAPKPIIDGQTSPVLTGCLAYEHISYWQKNNFCQHMSAVGSYFLQVWQKKNFCYHAKIKSL